MDKFSYRGDWSLDLGAVSFHSGDTGGVDKGGMISNRELCEVARQKRKVVMASQGEA
jgi:hypothetical protein